MFRLLGITFVLCLVGGRQPQGTRHLETGFLRDRGSGDRRERAGDGQSPAGYVVFNAEGRVFLVLTGEARKPAKTSQERAELYATLIAYAGTYRVEGDKWTTKVDVAWIPEWIGTEPTRSLTVDGDRLQVLSPWRVNPNWPDKRMTRSIVTFVRSN